MIILENYLKALKLPTFVKRYQEVAEACQKKGFDYAQFLLQLSEMEVLGRQNRSVQQKIKKARFPSLKTLDGFDFTALPSLNQKQVSGLAKCEYVERHENIIALGNSGTGKTHLAISLGIAACQKGISVYFTTAASLVHELMEAREEKQLLRLQKKLNHYPLLMIDELGFVPFSKTGAELLFEIFSNRYERGSVLITSNLPFQEWTQMFGCERLTGALLDRLTHHVHILEMNGESYRLTQSKKSQKP
jgi:DNA replication protein DnaC